MKNLIAIFLGLIFAGTVIAAPTGFVALSGLQAQTDAYFENGTMKAEIVNEINTQIAQAPEALFTVFGNKGINIYVTLDNGSTVEYFVKTGATNMQSASLGANAAADLEVRVNEATIDKVLNANEPVSALTEALNSGEVSYKALTTGGIFSSVAIGIAGFIGGIISFFANIFH